MDVTYQVLTWSSVIGSLVMKVPQVMTVVSTGSVKGIATAGILLELWAFTVMFAYQFAEALPLLQYVDYVLLLVQEIPLVLMVLYYNRHFNKWSALYGAVYFSVFGSVIAGVSSSTFNALLINSSTPIAAFSKLAQLSAILSQKSAGSVSVATWTLAAYTSFARMGTLSMAIIDWSLMGNFAVSGLLNSLIVMSCLYYGPGEVEKPVPKHSPPPTPVVSRDNSPDRPKISPNMPNRRPTRKSD